MQKLDGSLYTLQGRPLIAAQHSLSQSQIDAMTGAGLEVIMKVSPGEEEARFNGQREPVTLDKLHVGHPAAENLYDDEDRLLVGAGQKITEETVALLTERGYRYTFVHHNPDEKEYSRFIEQSTAGCIEKLDSLVKLNVDQLRIEPRGVSALRGIRIWQGNRRPQKMTEQLFRNYITTLGQVTEAFGLLRRGQVLTRKVLDLILDALMDILKEDKDLAMNLPNVPQDVDHLVKHSVDVCLLASATGLFLDYNPTQLRGLAEAALLHDLGMLHVPEVILSKPTPLTDGEKSRIYRHATYGLEILHRVQTGDASVALTIYQSHERESGHGYPGNLLSHQIHDYARVVAIADTYQALIQPRPHRDKQHPCFAIQSLVKMAKVGLMHRDFVLAFCRACGAYPIGSIVELPSGEMARVVSSNDRDIYRPRITVLRDADGRSSLGGQFMQVTPEVAPRLKPCTEDIAATFGPFQGF